MWYMAHMLLSAKASHDAFIDIRHSSNEHMKISYYKQGICLTVREIFKKNLERVEYETL